VSNGAGHTSDLSSLSMHDLFRMEAENQTAILAQGLLDLEKDAGSEEKLEALMRASHSVKGAARIVGIDAVVAIAHELEDCFVAAQRRQIELTSAHIDLLLKAVDTIVQIAHLDESESRQWFAQNQQAITTLQHQIAGILSGEPPPSVSVSTDEALLKDDTTAKKSGRGGKKVNTAELGSKSSDKAHIGKEIEERVVRVNADRLTRIMGLSSEMLVESGRLRPLTDSMLLLKRRQVELSNLLEATRESVEQTPTSERTRLHLLNAQRKLADCRALLSERLLELDDYDRRNSNLSSKIYNEVVASRMRPFSDCTQGLQRMVRDIARKLGKEAQLVIDGKDTPVDRDILEKIKAPITHLVRNAIDHGIEAPEVRKSRNKPQEGTVHLSASHVGGMLTIVVEDDGKGVALNELQTRIVERGLATEEMANNLLEAELLEFLFLPDFSTRTEVTEISGRGIGLDVVRSLVQEMHGKVIVTNKSSGGLRFNLQLPLTLSVISTLLVQIGGEPYAFPLSRVDRLVSVAPEQVKMVEGRQYISDGGELIGLVSASHVLELDAPGIEFDEFHVIVVSDRLSRYGVVVDHFIGQRELSVQSLDQRLGKVQDISAVSLAEDGIPVLILDVDDLVRSIDAMINGAVLGTLKPYTSVLSHKVRKRILVVDDSLTVREIERQLLEAQGYRVDVAVDGMDGWNAVRRNKYHLVVTDVDMPRMDGIALVNSMKQDNHLRSLPIMIVSYKDRPEDRQRGLEAGADYYLAKGSFHDETLIEAVVDLIGEATE
jgi:two-component system sensor histidine kinase and response regulator WspE